MSNFKEVMIKIKDVLLYQLTVLIEAMFSLIVPAVGYFSIVATLSTMICNKNTFGYFIGNLLIILLCSFLVYASYKYSEAIVKLSGFKYLDTMAFLGTAVDNVLNNLHPKHKSKPKEDVEETLFPNTKNVVRSVIPCSDKLFPNGFILAAEEGFEDGDGFAITGYDIPRGGSGVVVVHIKKVISANEYESKSGGDNS